jgi:cytidine deaminase
MPSTPPLPSPALSPGAIDDLLSVAEQALAQAYAPYSRLRVGAVVLTARGGRYAGCNVENRAYPLGGCAEHHAIAAAVQAEGPTVRLTAVAIAARDAEDRAVPIPPCGGCRQKLMEFSDGLQVAFLDASGRVAVHSLADLLPASFELPPAASLSAEPASR